jgi:Fe-S-cluster containining protein
MIMHLTRVFRGRHGVPIIDRVDSAIFEKTYFGDCLACVFCHDSCCRSGADIDAENVARLLLHGALAEDVGVSPEEWFPGPFVEDSEFPGGQYTRTGVKNGSCIFLNHKGRSCLIHAYAIRRGLEVREIKPLVCNLFPVTFERGLLEPSREIREASLVCMGPGPTLYRAIRGDLGYYFGKEFVDELDRCEITFRSAATDQ